MNSLAGLFARVPRPIWFALAGLIQLALIAAMVVDRARVLRDGTEVTLQTRPVDPRDFLRGDYVVLSYDISTVPTGELKGKLPQNRQSYVFVKLAPKDDGFYAAVSAHLDSVPVGDKDVLIRGRVTNSQTRIPHQENKCAEPLHFALAELRTFSEQFFATIK